MTDDAFMNNTNDSFPTELSLLQIHLSETQLRKKIYVLSRIFKTNQTTLSYLFSYCAFVLIFMEIFWLLKVQYIIVLFVR